MIAISDFDQLERALIDLEYAAADFKHAPRLKGTGQEIWDLRSLLQNLIVLNRAAQQSVKSLRQSSTVEKRKSGKFGSFERAVTSARTRRVA